MSTLRPHHVISVPRPSHYLPLSAYLIYYAERKPKNKKQGRPGNEATLLAQMGVETTTFPSLRAPFSLVLWALDLSAGSPLV